MNKFEEHNFKQLVPKTTRTSGYTGDKVRAHFPLVNKKLSFVCYIGNVIATRLGFKHGDRLGVGISEISPFVWYITKSDVGWKLVDIAQNKNRKSPPLLRLSFTWNEGMPIPSGMGKDIKFLNYDIWEGGLRLFLPGHDPEDRML